MAMGRCHNISTVMQTLGHLILSCSGRSLQIKPQRCSNLCHLKCCDMKCGGPVDEAARIKLEVKEEVLSTDEEANNISNTAKKASF